MKTVKDFITTIPDFPEEGILFRDITTVLAGLREDRFCGGCNGKVYARL